MYVAVDMKALRFLPYAHPTMSVLTNLVWLECDTEDEVWMFDAHDRVAFNGLTPYQQSQLYTNTTGAAKAPRLGEPLCRLLVELAERIPMRQDVQGARLVMQCDKVPPGGHGCYLYDPTGYAAVRKPDLWEKTFVDLPAHQNPEAVMAEPRRARPKHAPMPAPQATPAQATPWGQQPPKPAPAPAPFATLPKGATIAPLENASIKRPWDK